MPRESSRKNASRRTSVRRRGSSSRLSSRTTKQIDALPIHARHIYKKAHKNALEHYSSPSKRRGGNSQSRQQVAHKVAWSAVKRKYQKEGQNWVSKD